MPSQIIERPASEAERGQVEQMLRNSRTGAQRAKMIIENALVMWAIFTLAYFITWLVLAWVASKALHLEFGWKSPHALPISVFGVAVCGAFAIYSTARWARGWLDHRPQLRADIDSGKVLEEHYRFTEAKRFQEPEHGCLIYFLRTNDARTFVLYDAESQQLGVQGEDPLNSSFEPKTEFVMVRAPNTRYVLSQAFSGEKLVAGPPN